MRVDSDLVRLIESASAQVTAAHADALAGIAPDSGVAVEWFDGAALVALGAGRYVNRAVGFGLGTSDAESTLDALEEFFGPRSLPASAEVSPWVTKELLAGARRRGYGLEWFRDVFARELTDLPPRSTELVVAEVDESTFEEWREILSGEAPDGTSERAVSDEFCAARRMVPGTSDFVGSLAGRVITTGSLWVDGEIATLGGAATRTAARGQGAQRAMIVDRLHRIRDAGARLVTVTALADGSSARNLNALGFQLLYTQVVLTRDS